MKTCQILLISDDTIVKETLSQWIRRQGLEFEVCTVAAVPKVLEHFDANALLVDAESYRVDDMALLAWLKRRFPEKPMLLHTSTLMDEKGLLLSKPAYLSEFKTLLAKLCGGGD